MRVKVGIAMGSFSFILGCCLVTIVPAIIVFCITCVFVFECVSVVSVAFVLRISHSFLPF